MVDEALKSLRNLFLTTLVVLVLWFLTWPSAVEKLRQYRDAKDIHAWVLLKELIKHPELNVFDLDPEESISGFDVERLDARGNDYRDRLELEIRSVWPTEGVFAVTLVPEDDYRKHDAEIAGFARVYRVRADSADLPFVDYLAVFVNDLSFVVPAGDEMFHANSQRGLRLLKAAAGDRNQPRSWPAVAMRLTALGFDAHPKELTTTSPSLARLYENSDPRIVGGGVQIFGIKLSIAVFFSSVGIILAAVAFACIGPIVKLRNPVEASRQPWIMSLPRQTGPFGAILEWVVFSVSIAWAAAPIAVLVLQIATDTGLEGSSVLAVWTGGVGLVFASLVFLSAAAVLRGVRAQGAPLEKR